MYISGDLAEWQWGRQTEGQQMEVSLNIVTSVKDKEWEKEEEKRGRQLGPGPTDIRWH